MARYLVLIYGDEQAWATMSAQERQRLVDGHAAFTRGPQAVWLVLDGCER